MKAYKIISEIVIVLLICECIVYALMQKYNDIPVLLIAVVILSTPIIVSNIRKRKTVNSQIDELIDYINKTSQLPTFNIDESIILDDDEICHFSEGARLLEKVAQKEYSITKTDFLFEDYRVRERGYRSKKYTCNGMLYVTNKRIIFDSYIGHYVIPLFDIFKVTYSGAYTIIRAGHNTELKLDINNVKLFQAIINVLIYNKENNSAI